MAATFRTECFLNLSSTERSDIIKRRQSLRLDTVYRTYWGWMMLPFALLGAITTSLFICVVFKAVRDRRVSRKCYVLILNRALGDLLNCLSALCSVAYILQATNINRDIVPIFESFFAASFWCGTVSYAALSILKCYVFFVILTEIFQLFAVWKPFQYRKFFTVRRCSYITSFCWIVFLVIVLVTLGVSALVKIPALNQWSQCRMETCARKMYRVRNGMIVTLYFVTLIVFGLTVLIIRKAQQFGESFKPNRNPSKAVVIKSRFPLWKLALNVGTFALLNALYIAWTIMSLVNGNPCLYQHYLAERSRVYAFIRCCLILRCIVDPTLSFVTDIQLRRELFSMLGKPQWISSQRNLHKSYSDTSQCDSSLIQKTNSTAITHHRQSLQTGI